MRLIDADAIFTENMRTILEPLGNGQYEEVEIVYFRDIDNAPTIDQFQEEKDFVNELINYIFTYPDDDYMTMETLCRKLYKHGLVCKNDEEWICDTPQAERPCDNCQEWDCYGCDYKQTDEYAPVKHGRWVDATYNSVNLGIKKCSICGTYGNGHENYCHNCGARMDGGEE